MLTDNFFKNFNFICIVGRPYYINVMIEPNYFPNCNVAKLI